MKNKKYHTVGTVSKSHPPIVKTGKIPSPNRKNSQNQSFMIHTPHSPGLPEPFR
jgi:hypothetical protein